MDQFDKHIKPVDLHKIKEGLSTLKQSAVAGLSVVGAEEILSVIDHTTLDVKDTDTRVAYLCHQINNIPVTFNTNHNVAGICIYPRFVPVVKKQLKASGVNLVSVSGGFPSGQTPLEIKKRETVFAIEHGAQEIDIVIPVGAILEKKYAKVIEEIKEIKNVCPPGIVLKVILESGIYQDKADVQQAAVCALLGGADFLKTSTGKLQPAARPEDVWILANVVKTFHQVTGKKVGIKAAGGISSPEEALFYRNIIRSILGDHWISPNLFRIGASRLTNAILSVIRKDKGTNYF